MFRNGRKHKTDLTFTTETNMKQFQLLTYIQINIWRLNEEPFQIAHEFISEWHVWNNLIFTSYKLQACLTFIYMYGEKNIQNQMVQMHIEWEREKNNIKIIEKSWEKEM